MKKPNTIQVSGNKATLSRTTIMNK